jgi:hypothetical protein
MSRPRVLLVGGAGVFGSRLAQGLVATTNAEVLIAGRNLAKAQAAARATGAAGAVALNRNTATAADISALTPRLVIDAAGPFQGANLSFARACIEAGVDYIDLADARDFVAAFPTLDAEAKAANIRAITGASSTPAITHAALDELTRGWTRIDSIRAGISPGNRAPRGRSVIEAILSWAGAPVRVFERGEWRTRPGWSLTQKHAIPQLGRRRFALAETPDLDLVPLRFAPREDAIFSAGLELSFLHHTLGVIAFLRRAGLDLRPAAGPLQRLASLLLPFGSDRGTMFVEAFGRDADDRPTRAEWTLVSPPVTGPFTPTLPALALARKLLAGKPIPSGAQPCIGLITLDDLAADFARHDLVTGITRERLTGPFEHALGAAFDLLPVAIRESHRQGPVARFSGTARVAGSSLLGFLPARLFGFPPRADAAPVTVRKQLLGPGHEIWERQIATSRFASEIRYLGPNRVTERFGPFTFTLALEATETGHTMRIAGWRLGPLPLPALLAPRSIATETETSGVFNFDVPIAAPLAGRLTHYKGELHNDSTGERAT